MNCYYVILLRKSFAAEEETPEYWYNVAKEELQVALKQQTHNMNVAKNVILFLGKYDLLIYGLTFFSFLFWSCLHFERLNKYSVNRL